MAFNSLVQFWSYGDFIFDDLPAWNELVQYCTATVQCTHFQLIRRKKYFNLTYFGAGLLSAKLYAYDFVVVITTNILSSRVATEKPRDPGSSLITGSCLNASPLTTRAESALYSGPPTAQADCTGTLYSNPVRTETDGALFSCPVGECQALFSMEVTRLYSLMPFAPSESFRRKQGLSERL